MVGSYLRPSRKRIIRHYIFCFSGRLFHSWIVSAWSTAYVFSFKFSLLETIQCCAREVAPCMINLKVTLTLSSTSDVIRFDQYWYHVYPTAAGRKGLCNNIQIRVITLMELRYARKCSKS